MNQGAVDIYALRLALARSDLNSFIRYTMPDYMMGWVHERIAAELNAFLEAVRNRESPRLMLTMPPRHGKTEIASRRFPAFVLGRYPDMSIIGTSYSADLSNSINRDIQRIMDSQLYGRIFPDTKIGGKAKGTNAPGSYMQNSGVFEIADHRGSYRSSGVGGGITGMGCDIAIVDDPFKSRTEADSATIRKKVWEWYTSTLYTRLSPGGGVIVINTRWHMDDLSGRLLEAAASGEGDQWRIVNFPAIAETDEERRRQGEALHPERYPLEKLEAIRRAIGTRDWEALYQQHPTPEGGAIFRDEWLKRTWLPKDIPARFDMVIQSWDMTFSNGDSSDYVVGQLWGKKGADLYLLDQLRGRWSFTESVDMVRRLTERAERFERGATRKLIEDKANGPAVIDTLKREISGIIPVQPDGPKVARAHAVTALFEAGNVLLPDMSICPWVYDYKLELTQFPNAAHDDQVDATTQALRYMTVKPGLNLAPQIHQRARGFSRVF